MTYYNIMSSYEIYRKKNDKDDKFWKWILFVETEVFKKLSIKLIELPDENYRVNFDSGMTTNEMIIIILDQYL